MGKKRCLSVFLVLFGCIAFSQPKSEEEYWKDVGLDFSQVEAVLDETHCYSSEKEFFACGVALGKLFEFESKSVWVLPEAQRLSDPSLGSALETFGSISLVLAKKTTAKTRSAVLKESREEKKARQKAWLDLYKDKTADKIDFAALFKFLRSRSYFSSKESSLTANGMNGILSVIGDPHTQYMPSAYWKALTTEGASDIVGIGAALQKPETGGKNLIVISHTLEGSPAEKAGLMAGDIILKVDGEDIQGKSLTDVTMKIRGKEGESVEIEYERAGKVATVKVLREKIKVKNLTYKRVGTKNEVGLLKLRSFSENDASGNPTPCRDVKMGVSALEKMGVKSLILDLRDNGGGYLGEAVCIVNIFVDLKKDEPVLFTKGFSATATALRYPFKAPEKALTKLPLVLLMDSGSASASEIVAGALQDYHRAFLVGERSWGKGSVQTVYTAGTAAPWNKMELKKTISRFYLPSGRTNQIVGISPDVEAYTSPIPTEDDKAAFREEDLYSALPAKGSAWVQPRQKTIDKLSTCISKLGSAADSYKTAKSSGLPFDYPLGAAIDAAQCTVSELLWRAADIRPTFGKDLATLLLP